MSDSPPADWYTDPEDHEQYRYWDGSAWTEHRSPRHTDTAATPPPQTDTALGTSGLRGPGTLIGDSFKLSLRQWKSLSVAALFSVAGAVLLTLLTLPLATLDASPAAGSPTQSPLDLDFSAQVSPTPPAPPSPPAPPPSPGPPPPLAPPPAFAPPTSPQPASVESHDPGPFLALTALAFGVLLYWVASNMTIAAATRITLSDLRDRPVSVGESLTAAVRRVPRLMGLDLQVAVLVFASMAMTVVAVVLAMLAIPLVILPILLVPALIVAWVLGIAVLSLAYVVAAAGPSQPSLLYAARLVRERFWAALGRVLLVILVFIVPIWVVSVVAAVVAGVTGIALGESSAVLWLQTLNYAVLSVVAAALGVVSTVAVTILYDDLGGESD